MTSNLLSAVSRPSGFEKLENGGRPHAIFPFTIIFSALFLTGPASLPSGSVDDSPRAVVDSSFWDAQETAKEILPEAISPKPRHNKAIELLAGTISKRYRISQHATRSLIRVAYLEAERVQLDPLLIIAVIAVESRFNPIAESDGGAVGLMQVIPRYHPGELRAIDPESVLDPLTNIQLGARVLKDYIERGGSEVAGLQLYNGAGADASNAYASKVLGEKQRLAQAIRRDI